MDLSSMGETNMMKMEHTADTDASVPGAINDIHENGYV